MKVPKPVKLPSGAWRVQIMKNGKRISKTFGKEEDAIIYAIEVVAEIRGFDIASEDVTVEQAAKRFVDRNQKILSPSTALNYKSMINSGFSLIGKIPIKKLTQNDVNRWVTYLQYEGKSPKTILNYHGLLSKTISIYRPAFKLNTKLPKYKKTKIQIPTAEEIRTFTKEAQGTKYELPIALAIYLGLRASEICGLTWDCIKGDTVEIKQARVRGEGGRVDKTPKTYAGYRVLELNPYIMGLIEKQPKTSKYVVTISGNAIRKGFDRICEKAGVPHYRFHDLRHVNASVMLGENIPINYIVERMGHATPDMVNRVYGHVMEHKMKSFNKAIDKGFEELFEEPEEKEKGP